MAPARSQSLQRMGPRPTTRTHPPSPAPPLQPLLRGEPAPADWRKSFYYRYYELGTHNVAAHEAVVTADHKLIHYTARLNQGKREAIDEWDLIDLRLDPQELRSFYPEPSHQPIREALHRELERLRVELKAD